MTNCSNCKIDLPKYTVKFCSECGDFLDRDDFGIKEELDWDLKHPVEIDPLITSDTRIFPDSIISPVLFPCQ